MRNCFAAVLAASVLLTPASLLAQQPTAKAAAQSAAAAGEDAAAYFDARIAAVKVALKLKPEQEKGWPALESAIRDMQKQRVERTNKFKTAAAVDPASSQDPIAMLRRRADMMAETAASLKQFAAAAEPFYKSLDDAQKNRLRVLLIGMNRR
ncbi:MAG TPA: Spy/CpxP family protein refolding chaperone [Pseudolabrys sp.]|nr:Spy/CpxP family protein refolding chaperone [Pseudolabrys sp.]